MLNITSAMKAAKTVITANSPVLLLGTTIAGVVTTGVLAAKAGYNARGIVDEEIERRLAYEEAEYPLTLTPQEIAQLTYKCYALPVISGAGAIASAVGTHTIHTKRAKGMSALYAVATTKLDDYQERAEALLGPKKTQQLQDEVGQLDVDRHPIDEGTEILVVGDGTELCRDMWSGRYFYSSMPKLETAFNDLNRTLLDKYDVSLNDYYDRIGLDPLPVGDDFGWSGAKIEPRFGGTVASDGRPAITVSFLDAPKRV